MDRLLQYYIIMNMKVKWQNDRKMETDSGVGWSLMMTLMATASGEFWRLLMTLTNNLDPDEAPQNVGPHLESKLFNSPIMYLQRFWMKTMILFAYFERKHIDTKVCNKHALSMHITVSFKT